MMFHNHNEVELHRAFRKTCSCFFIVVHANDIPLLTPLREALWTVNERA